MPITPEDRARQNIDKLLTDAGWLVQDQRATNLSAGRGVAMGEFPLKSGHGEADYLLFFDGSPIGVVEAKEAIHSVLRYIVEDVERRGKAIALAVQNEREELRKQGVDADKYFGKKREEYAEALAAR